MAVTEASFKAFFPEFAATDTARVERCIAVAEACVNETVFGDAYDVAASYLAAHILNQDPQSLDTPAYASTYDASGNVVQANVQQGRKAVQGTSKYLNVYNRLKGAVVVSGFVA